MKKIKSVFEYLHEHHDKLFEILKKKKVLSENEAETLVHALVDISESIEKIYFELLPSLFEVQNISQQQLEDRLWEIRDEFRHIQYHINDAKLTDL